MPQSSYSINTNAMMEAPNRTDLLRVEASRIEDHSHVTYKATCPFCRAVVIDRDNNAAGCWHAKELQIGYAGSIYFIFERPH